MAQGLGTGHLITGEGDGAGGNDSTSIHDPCR